RLSSLHTHSAPVADVVDALVNDSPTRARVRRGLWWFSATERSLILGTFAMFLNVAFLAEVLAFICAEDRIHRYRSQLVRTFEQIGTLDAAIAVASFLERFPEHCRPEVMSSKTIVLDGGYHPLLAR